MKLFKTAFKNNKSNWKWLGITIALELCVITLLYFLNQQYGFLYQGIQDYNTKLIWKSVATFAGLAGVLVVFAGYTTFFANKLAFGIREGLTNFYSDKLFTTDTLQDIPNVGQRLQEDIRNFGRFSVEFWLSIFKAVIKLPLFLGVIIGLTQWWVGVIVLIAVILGTLATKIVSNKLIKYQVIQESNEAEFRRALQQHQNPETLATFASIKQFFLVINTQIKKLNFLQSGLGQTFVLMPFIILLPLYISKTITMGAFFQSVNALAKVIDSLTILIDNRMLIADVQTTVERMRVLD